MSAIRPAPTLPQALLPLVSLLLLLSGGCGFLGYRMEPMLLLATAIAAGTANRIGYTWAEMEKGIVDTLGQAMPAILIMIAIGMMIASWIASGTIPMLIYLGARLISPKFFLLSALVICSIASLFTGTSWGTVGTVGVALMGVASTLGISREAAAGAIISGAYFGDKLSPLSDQTNLAPAMAGAKVPEHIRWLLWTTTPAWLLAAIVYASVGFATEALPPIRTSEMQLLLNSAFHLNAFVLIPPLIVAACLITRRPVLPSILLASGAGMAVAVVVQGRRVSDVLEWAVTGYQSRTSVPDLDVLLSRGGMAAMVQVLMLLFCAFAFSGIMVRCGLFARILDALLGQASGTFRLILLTGLTGLMTSLITGSSHLSVLIPGQLFREAYRAAGLAAKNLSRTTEDFGTAVVPLIPWSAAGLFMSSTLAVATMSYLPWAIMNYTGLLFAIFYGASGFAIARNDAVK